MSSKIEEEFEQPPLWVLVVMYTNYMALYIFGYIADFCRRWNIGKTKKMAQDHKRNKGFSPLHDEFASFFTRNMYMRMRDRFNSPIQSVPGDTFELMDRKSDDQNWTFYFTGKAKKSLNFGSYNYLGFAENTGKCAETAEKTTEEMSCTFSSPRSELGTSKKHLELEEIWSAFLGVEATITFGMGFATNSLNIPAIAGPSCLILSDELNHASLVLGIRLSGAKTIVYKHNDMQDLENKIRNAIINGQDRTFRPYKKIIIVVEGIYSMEGSVVNLPKVIELKKKYNAYLYLDEAHSIGALGSCGRGVVEHFDCDVNDVDIMMGTFTKSFGAAGGYISGKKNIINYLRKTSHAHKYACSMSPGVCEQIIQASGAVASGQGKRRLVELRENALHFRQRLKKMGFIVFGNDFSPVVPLLLYVPSKIALFGRLMEEAGIAVVVVGFPATPIESSRVRFCLSASHSRAQIDQCLKEIDRIGNILQLKHSSQRKLTSNKS
ncbi:unnamed protein product [Oikopleura dioica]|uniref:serine C-palmitoyltransferase n=1 Tax=Oikopleura dioica TaxID=34765 RepID=E4XC11_OIKDI|nr:unnamed protein product [Oikopleura dioica]